MGSGIGISENLDDVKLCRLSMEELGSCENNREDYLFPMEVCVGNGGGSGVVGTDNGVSNSGNGKEVEVDVVGNAGFDVVERESTDATECSSSFGCTDSESGVAEGSGDMEVESQFRDDNSMLIGFDGCGDLFRTRKKKLSDHWRKFVRPLMWRCKWAELHIRELESQAAKYARELAECDKRKQCELEKFPTEDHAMKSTPFVNQNLSVKLMKRKKRRRVEETTDLASYTTSHSLFSYFVNTKSGGTASVKESHCQAGKIALEGGELRDDELASFHCKDSDAFESILRHIEKAQLHIRQLRTRVDKVVRETAKKIAPHDPLTSSEQNLVPSHVNNDPELVRSMRTVSQWSSKKLLISRTPADMLVTIDNPLTGRECQNIANARIINNRPVKEEFNSSDDHQIQLLAEFPHEPEEKPEIGQQIPDPNAFGKIKMSQEQPITTPWPLLNISFPKNKRKRGKRKARTGRWSKRSSG